MLRQFGVLSSVLAAASATMEVPTRDIAASSQLGARILSHARKLGDNDNFSWVAGYSLKFEKCATSDEYYGGYFGGEEGGGNGRQNYNGMYKQRLIHFKLCPTESCSSGCSNGADYVIDMNVYVEAYIQSKLEAQEYNCEMVQENCNCENANDEERCEYQCYLDAGLDYCGDRNGDQNDQEFDLEEAVQCSRLEVDEDALAYYYYKQNGNNGQQYYYQNGGQGNGEMELFVGPYCSANGKQIYLGVFWDETCSLPASDGTYEQFNYGHSLPYTSESLVEGGCLSCQEPQDANNDDQQDEDEVLEVCERLYEDSGKCEDGLADGVTYYPNSYACEFISSLHAPGKMSTGKSSVPAANVFAGLFLVTTTIFGAVAYYFYIKAKRNNVSLSDQGGAMA